MPLGQGAIYGRLHDRRAQKCEAQSHADGALAAPLASGNLAGIARTSRDELIKPQTCLGDSLDQARARFGPNGTRLHAVQSSR